MIEPHSTGDDTHSLPVKKRVFTACSKRKLTLNLLFDFWRDHGWGCGDRATDSGFIFCNASMAVQY
jgi:hypothetical protein